MRIVHQYRFPADAHPVAFDHSAVHSKSRGLRATVWQARVGDNHHVRLGRKQTDNLIEHHVHLRSMISMDTVDAAPQGGRQRREVLHRHEVPFGAGGADRRVATLAVNGSRRRFGYTQIPEAADGFSNVFLARPRVSARSRRRTPVHPTQQVVETSAGPHRPPTPIPPGPAVADNPGNRAYEFENHWSEREVKPGGSGDNSRGSVTIAIDSAGLGKPMTALHLSDEMCPPHPDFIYHSVSGGQ